MKATTKQAYFRSASRLLLPLLSLLLLFSSPGGAQSVVGQAMLNDLTFILGPDQPRGSRREVYDELQAFATRHSLVVSLTTLREDDPYITLAREQESTLLQQSAPVLAITTWYEIEPKVLQRTQVQVNPALATRLSQATAEQIVTEWLTYYHNSSPITEDALRQGMLLALERLDDYLNALPPEGQVPPITFANPAAVDNNPPTGLDELRYPALQGNYEQLEISEAPYPVAWKALPSGKTTPVLAQVDQSTSFPPGLVFVQNGNRVASQPASQTYQQQLTLTGQAHQQEGSVEVYASEEEGAELVGKLNTISYDALPQKLVLVPLNRSISRYELLPLVDRVAAIYRQANVDLKVDVSEPLLMEDWAEDHALEDSTLGLLANYTKEMRQVIRAFNRQQDTDKEAAYVFLYYQSASGKRGYMPKKRPYGFVFDKPHGSDDREVAKTIAHELGHGLFRLEHSWQTYLALDKGSSDNLMDYQERGTRLHKDQWDAIHNPKAMLGWFQDEEENALDGCFWAKSFIKYNQLFGQAHPLEADLPRYEEVRDNFDTYWQQSKDLFAQHRFGNDKENNLALKADPAWTIRNASHYRKKDATYFVDLAVKRMAEQKPRVQLHPEGITLAKITLEDIPFRVALHSAQEHTDPDYIRVGELCDLVDTKEVQVLIEDGQLLIAYMKQGQVMLVLQVLSDDWDHGALWLKYLGIYVAEDSEANWFSTIPRFWEDWTWGEEEAQDEDEKSSNFEKYQKKVFDHEGGFVDDPVDKGGATNKGITFNTFKLYAKTDLGIEPTLNNLKTLTNKQAAIIYKKRFWEPIKADDINNASLAYALYDFNVNAGNNAAKTLQKVLNNMGSALVVDGKIGPKTIKIINSKNPKALFNKYRQARIDYYKNLVNRSVKKYKEKYPKATEKDLLKNTQKRFLKGWLNRANSITYKKE